MPNNNHTNHTNHTNQNISVPAPHRATNTSSRRLVKKASGDSTVTSHGGLNNGKRPLKKFQSLRVYPGTRESDKFETPASLKPTAVTKATTNRKRVQIVGNYAAVGKGEAAPPRITSNPTEPRVPSSEIDADENQETTVLMFWVPECTKKSPPSSCKTNVTCPTCQKIYTQRSMEFHEKACLARKVEEERRRCALESEMEKSKNGPTRPPGTLCYICGRRYTRSSWQWHEPKCLEQWNVWNNRLPKQMHRWNGPLKPQATEEELSAMVEKERMRGNQKYSKRDAHDQLMYEASRRNALPLEYL